MGYEIDYTKDWDKLEGRHRQKTMQAYAKNAGIDVDKYQEADRGSQGNYDYDGLEEELTRNYNNNYDMRRSSEAARLAGYEGADDLSVGIGSMENLHSTSRFMRDVHDDNLEGKYKASGVTDYLVNQDRDKLMDSFQQSAVDDTKPEDEAGAEIERQEYSYNDYLNASTQPDADAEDQAQTMMKTKVKEIASTPGATEKGKFNMGKYALTNLGGKTFGGAA